MRCVVLCLTVVECVILWSVCRVCEFVECLRMVWCCGVFNICVEYNILVRV